MNDVAMDRQDRSRVLAFVCGTVTGATLGILFAPARGRDTRHSISGTAREGRERISRLVKRNRRAMKRQKERVGAFVDSARSQVGDIKAGVVGAVQDARSAFESARKEAADR